MKGGSVTDSPSCVWCSPSVCVVAPLNGGGGMCCDALSSDWVRHLASSYSLSYCLVLLSLVLSSPTLSLCICCHSIVGLGLCLCGRVMSLWNSGGWRKGVWCLLSTCVVCVSVWCVLSCCVVLLCCGMAVGDSPCVGVLCWHDCYG